MLSTGEAIDTADTAAPVGDHGGPWRGAIAVVAAGLAAIIGIYWESAAEIVALWSRAAAYNYGFLIIPISLYVIWERREAVAALRPSPNVWWLGLLLVFGVLWRIAELIDVAEGRHFALVGMTQSLLLAALGWRVFRALLFPFLYLWLVVPTGWYLLWPLQKITTFMAVTGIKLIGVPVFVQGVIVQMPNAVYRVAPECAGLNFLLSSLALSLLFAVLMYRGWVKQTACVAVMLMVSVVANGLRVFSLMVAGNALENGLSIIDDHLFYGWGFFAVIIVLMMWFGLRFRDPEPDTGAHPAAGAPAVGFTRLGAVVAAAVAVAAIPPVYAAYGAGDGRAATVAFDLPRVAGEWRASPAESEWTPVFPTADAWRKTTYTRGVDRVDLFVAYFARQTRGREVIAYNNNAADGKNWISVSGDAERITLNAVPMAVKAERLRSGGKLRAVWQWFWVDGQFTANSLVAKLLQAKAEFFGGDRRAAAIIVSAPEGHDPTVARAAMQALLDALGPLEHLLSAVAPTPAED